MDIRNKVADTNILDTIQDNKMEQAKEWMVFINGLLTLGVIGFIIRFSLMMKTAFKEKEDVLQKRLDAFEEELKRTEKWAARKRDELIKERDELKQRLEKTLTEANVDTNSFDLLNAVQKINSEFKTSLREISSKIESLGITTDGNNYELNISMAKAFASNGEWFKAATQYDIVTRGRSDNWELYFYKGVAYANSRKGLETNLKALQSYADAIVYLPSDLDVDMKARLFIYKGAMLKRLNRLDESENYIKIGLKYAEASYEINDGLYNLACIYAMKNDTENFSKISEKLKTQDSKKYKYLLEKIVEYAPKFKIKNSA